MQIIKRKVKKSVEVITITADEFKNPPSQGRKSVNIPIKRGMWRMSGVSSLIDNSTEFRNFDATFLLN